MLSLTRLQNPNIRRERVNTFLKNSGQPLTWVVSDLRSKFEIQTLLMERQGYYEDFDVIRASELWRILLRRVDPQFRLISSDLVRARVKDQLESMDLHLGLSADQAICDFMDQMSPILFHPLGTEKLNEWFAENPESQNRWGSWYQIAEKFATLFVNEKRVAPHWVAPLLLRLLPANIGTELNLWDRDLIFDLGPELSQVETDLITILSQALSVEILAPWPSFADRFKFLLAPYETLMPGKSPPLPVKPLATTGETTRVIKSFRFSGMLAEIKHAVATSRLWLEQGVKPEQILLVAPDIEAYWPVLSRFLQEEGIPVNKDVMTRLQSLPVISEWLAVLKLKSGQVTSGDLEQATYGNELSQFETRTRYEDFHAIFSQLLDAEDLGRLEVISKAFAQTLDPNSSISLDQFLGQALRLWTRTDLAETIEIFLKEILSQTDAELHMKFTTWIFYAERMLAKKELRLQPATSDGLMVSPLLAGDSINATRRIFLGLSESQLKSRSSPLVLPKEILSFNRDYGFYLQYPETSQKSFELEWLAQVRCEEDHFCFPMTHLNGTLEAPSQFWMNLRIELEGLESLHRLDLPEITRWDQVQALPASAIFQNRNLDQEFIERALMGLDLELGTEGVSERLPLLKKPRLSASSFERFRECPFIFVAEKVFQLKDPPEVDLDLDRRIKGTLAHALLERLLVPPIRWQWSREELNSLIEGLRGELSVPFMEPAIWNGILTQHIELALRFLDFEKVWQQKYPQNQNLAREKSFGFEFSDYQFTGKIDRIDGNSEGSDLVLIDYKMGESSVKTFNTWFKENTLQLGFYTWAIERGFVEGFGGHRVVAAFYYVLKNLDRTQGFKLKEGPEGLYDLEKRKAQIDEKQKSLFFEQLEAELKAVIHRLNEGQLGPAPRDFDVCETCQWRRLCRAPHLN